MRKPELRAIGISNFYPDRLVDLASFTRIPPMVNQIETHVLNQRTEDHEWMGNIMLLTKHGHPLERAVEGFSTTRY